jgi:Mlc titration factor MtfA (ptsG expression regulator)
MELTPGLYRKKLYDSMLFSAAIALAAVALVLVPFMTGWIEEAGGFDELGSPILTFFGASAGIAAVWTASVLLLTRRVRRRKLLVSRPFPPDWEEILLARLSFYRGLSGPERDRFRRSTQIFLGEKKITGIRTEVDDVTRLLTAASAIIPVFGLPDWEYDRLSEILIYPSRFNDEYEFVNRKRAYLGMVVAPSSTVILAKPALLDGFRSRRDTLNTGIHEFLHKIDSEDGALDGVPSLLLDAETAPEWERIVRYEIGLIERGSSDIDPYAIENETEFFPVAGEYFFEAPLRMSRRHPELYALFVKMFRRDPFAQPSS